MVLIAAKSHAWLLLQQMSDPFCYKLRTPCQSLGTSLAQCRCQRIMVNSNPDATTKSNQKKRRTMMNENKHRKGGDELSTRLED